MQKLASTGVKILLAGLHSSQHINIICPVNTLKVLRPHSPQPLTMNPKTRKSTANPTCKSTPTIVGNFQRPRRRVTWQKDSGTILTIVRQKYKIKVWLGPIRQSTTRYFVLLVTDAVSSFIKSLLITHTSVPHLTTWWPHKCTRRKRPHKYKSRYPRSLCQRRKPKLSLQDT